MFWFYSAGQNEPRRSTFKCIEYELGSFPAQGLCSTLQYFQIGITAVLRSTTLSGERFGIVLSLPPLWLRLVSFVVDGV